MAKGKQVKKDDLVEIEGTGKSKFLAKGKKVSVHSVQAEKLVESGKAALVGEKSKNTKDK